jgi:hypothetical protein
MSPNAMTNANLFVNAIVRAAETSVWPTIPQNRQLRDQQNLTDYRQK